MTHIFRPERMPTVTRPLSARPMIKANDVGAVAQTIEPMQKTKNDISNIVFIE